MTRAHDWTGRVGDVWADEWRRTERAFAGLAPHLDAAILAAAPAGPIRALDIGCGVGSTSLALAAARPDATVTGVDLSDALVGVARDRGAAQPHAVFRHGDALAAAASLAPLDLLASRHGVMFFDDPAAAFASLRAAVRPGAPFVFSCFADPADNCWATLIAAPPAAPAAPAYAPGPFAFAHRATTAALLEHAGWHVEAAVRTAFAYRVGEGDDPVEDAASFLARIGPAATRLRDASAAERPALAARLRAALAAQRNGRTIDFAASAWIWTVRAAEGERR